MIWTLPNMLTMARILAGLALPALPLVIAAPAAGWAAVAVFAVAAITDFLDGFLARRLGQASALGAVLDPAADKIMVICTLILLVGQIGPVAWLIIPAVVIVAREFLVAGLRAHVGQVAGGLTVSRLAKMKTAVQMVALGALLLAQALGSMGWLMGLGAVLLALAAVLTLASGADYMRKAATRMMEETR